MIFQMVQPTGFSPMTVHQDTQDVRLQKLMHFQAGST